MRYDVILTSYGLDDLVLGQVLGFFPALLPGSKQIFEANDTHLLAVDCYSLPIRAHTAGAFHANLAI